jgi:exopolysaccharide biosynthesis polyprenyl glycosylphosphotransferase
MSGRTIPPGVGEVGRERLATLNGARSTANEAANARLEERLLQAVDDRTWQLLEHRRRTTRPKDRGWLVRRLLLVADLLGLSLAFLLSVGVSKNFGHDAWIDFGILIASLPVWIVAAKLFGLYDEDESRADHSTLDDLARVFLLVTVGAFPLALVAGYSNSEVLLFWACGIAFVTTARAVARLVSRRTLAYVQNAVIVGAGDIGQLVARKLLHHHEYGINLVGFVDSEPKERQPNLQHVTLLGAPEELAEIVRLLGIQRVIIAFSRDDPQETLQIIRSLRHRAVQIDIVPRLFEIVGPNAEVHALEAMPMLGLPPARPGRSSRLIKRTTDVVGAALLLMVTSPLFALFAWRIKRESPGRVFFRQRRLGINQEEFTVLKFRTMRVDADEGPHRDYIRNTMNGGAGAGSNGLFKLERRDDVTRFGAWLRTRSFDELPQLINVLRGEMSLVGPRPCLPYEVEHFAPHHFERFLVPAGMTGLWQVTARAHSNFGEALDMDVLYARSWSVGLDFKLLLRTPLHLLRSAATS